MVAKRPQQETDLQKLTAVVQRGFVSVDTKFTALAEDIATVKGDLAGLKTEILDRFDHVDEQFRASDDRLRSIASEIAVIHRRIVRLEEQGASNAGFAKEIDHLLARVADIEKHLGLNKKMAA